MVLSNVGLKLSPCFVLRRRDMVVALSRDHLVCGNNFALGYLSTVQLAIFLPTGMQPVRNPQALNTIRQSYTTSDVISHSSKHLFRTCWKWRDGQKWRRDYHGWAWRGCPHLLPAYLARLPLLQWYAAAKPGHTHLLQR
ncbi:hypothetical protein BS47DRAFT_958575 [Hydnum rufescens UP504]|uniref:Uncharacterized protein n=1 Tax=Hydnum rufescens UP504 TaxID=1448309 RepID=A0A9P6AD47_9AGAM|nr:hypothetical protein BS47DRAFT_958575 [Hydnum rufescens UP504]